jgi:hypothetical protein
VGYGADDGAFTALSALLCGTAGSTSIGRCLTVRLSRKNLIQGRIYPANQLPKFLPLGSWSGASLALVDLSAKAANPTVNHCSAVRLRSYECKTR